MNKLLFPLTFSLLLVLTACSNTNNNLIIAPQLTSQFSPIYHNVNAHFDSKDMRPSRHIMQIVKEGKAAQLVNANVDLNNILTDKFTHIFTQQGIQLNNATSTNITLFIDKALISVQQTLVKYQASNEIVLRLQVQSSEKTLTKTFRIHGKSHGPLMADIAVLERDFNQQLAKLITQIVNDSEVIAFINKQS